MSAAPGRRTRRVAWGTTAQCLSSASNFLVGLIVVRSVSLDDFGAFSITYALYLFCVGAFRAFGGRTFAIKFTNADDVVRADAQAALGGFALVFGLAAALPLMAVGALVLTGPLQNLLVVLGLLLPFLLLQDAWRFSFVAGGRPASAAANELVWLAAQAGLFTLVILTTEPTVVGLFAAWAVAGTAAAAFGMIQARRWPHVVQGVRFAATHARLGSPLLGEHVVSQGANQVGILALGAILPLSSVGTLRAGQLMLSPLNVLQQAAPLTGLPEAVRARSDARSLDRVARVIAAALVGSTVALGAVILVVPDSWGAAVFGDGWEAGLEVLPALLVRNAAGGVTIGAFVGLQALERTGTTLRIGAVRGLLSVAVTIAAAWLMGLTAAVWAMAMADLVAAVLAAVAFRSANRTSPRVHATARNRADEVAVA